MSSMEACYVFLPLFIYVGVHGVEFFPFVRIHNSYVD